MDRPDMITTITLEMPMRLGQVNCYLLKAAKGYALIDNGPSRAQNALLTALGSVDCNPGALSLLLLTHGDFDHTGNTAFLKRSFGAAVAMHEGDVGMARYGDMFVGRKKPNIFIRLLMAPLTGFGKEQRFSPDLMLVDGQDLLEYGLDAKVLSMPGHSKGSLGILTRQGNFFCGDLFENRGNPALNSLMDDMPAAGESLRRLQDLDIRMVYPGHGEPFEWEKVAKYLPG